MAGFAKRACVVYSGLLIKHPMLTKVSTGVGIYTFGDVSMQRLEHRWDVEEYYKKKSELASDGSTQTPPPAVFKWNSYRTLRMSIYGGLWLSSFLNVWYSALDKIFIGRTGASMVGKLLLDQSFAATTNMTMFYTINGMLEHGSPARVKDTLETRLWPTMTSLWTVWVPVQMVNLTIVPVHLRVLVVNCIGVGWSIYLSYFGNKKMGAVEDRLESEVFSLVPRP